MHDQDSMEMRSTLLIAGGVALLTLGAGLILASPGLRRTLFGTLTPLLSGGKGSGNGPAGALQTDVERYLKLRAM